MPDRDPEPLPSRPARRWPDTAIDKPPGRIGLAACIWAPLVPWTLFHLLDFFVHAHARDVSAPQQAAGAGMTLVYVVSAYVCARAADAILLRR